MFVGIVVYLIVSRWCSIKNSVVGQMASLHERKRFLGAFRDFQVNDLQLETDTGVGISKG